MIAPECPVHGLWLFPDSVSGLVSATRFEREHRDCRWPQSTRRFPPKSRKRWTTP